MSDPEPFEIELASALRELGSGKGVRGGNDLILRPCTYQGTARKLLERLRLGSGLTLTAGEMSTTGFEAPASLDKARNLIAWLLWCADQGYADPGDRAILTNWIGDAPDQLTADDVRLRGHLLAMADEIIAEVAPVIRAAGKGKAG